MIALVIPILLALVLESNAGCACKPCSCMKPKCPPPVVCPPPMCRVSLIFYIFHFIPFCSQFLIHIFFQNLSNDMAISKGNIQNAAEEAMKAHINVICAKGDLSYSTHTDSFCQAENDAITCYAFKA
ncbi:unnamed protein product [Dracunculus medinensis]|uniref:Ground-like domain-containing protein n=1 Tax=Dracunculus medinensis TaxID=318479 RepID=A0A0N4UGU8_DRAME|nr:unnamed protein product [Dracunculus medinensis]